MAKLTQTQLKEQSSKIQEEVEKAKGQIKKGENFTEATQEEIDRKLRRTNSPFIIFQGWTSSTTPGGTINYSVGIWNPDPTDAIWLFAHYWIGSGNIDPTVGTFLLNVDPRFPRLTLPAFPGLTIAPSTSQTLTFDVQIPTGIQTTNYLGNTCLMQFNWHDVGLYLDRSVAPFTIV